MNCPTYRVHFNWDNGHIEIKTIDPPTWVASFESEWLAQIACDALNKKAGKGK